MSQAQRLRDNGDCLKIYQWFTEHPPFPTVDAGLVSLSTGITADDNLTCDRAEEVGNEIQEKIDNVMLSDAKIKRSERVTCLDSKTNAVTIEKKSVTVN